MKDNLTIQGIEFWFEEVWHKGSSGCGCAIPDFWATNFYRLHDHGMRKRKFLWWKWEEPHYEDEYCFWIEGRIQDYTTDKLKALLDDKVEGYLEKQTRKQQIKNKKYI